MTLPYLAIAGAVSFAITFVFVKWLISSLKGTSLVGVDIHKRSQPRIPEMGGIAVFVGFYAGLILPLLIATDTPATPFFSPALLAILGAAFVGLLDDLFAIRKLAKAVLPFLFAVPLGVLLYLSGNTLILGINVGILMVILAPLGITSAANAANMLEGFNGLGAGLGLIMSGGLILLSSLLQASEALYLLVPLFAALLAFLWFNRFPARVFPGDSLMLMTGAAVASAAIISSPSFKLYGFVLFLPMIAEVLLKARGRFRAENYGTVGNDNRLAYAGRVESLAHLVMRSGRFREWEVVAILWAIEAVLVALVLASALLLGMR